MRVFAAAPSWEDFARIVQAADLAASEQQVKSALRTSNGTNTWDHEVKRTSASPGQVFIRKVGGRSKDPVLAWPPTSRVQP